MSTYTPLRFSRDNSSEFTKVLRARVRQYFKENNLSKHADYRMVIKTISMILIYTTPLALIVSGVVSNPFGLLGLYIVMGIGLAGIGLSIMHDANHGAYSSSPRVNNIIGGILNVIGGYALNWKIQHNVLHHSFTNIEGHDEDIAPGNVLRFSPHAKRFKLHKFQHVYAWFFYGLMTLMWSTVKDFKQLARYKKKGLLKNTGKSFRFHLTELIIWKLVFYAYIFGLPIFVGGVDWWLAILGFVCMQFTSGLILAAIFQPAHVFTETEYPLPNEHGSMDDVWFVHQLRTTANFGMNSKVLSWYCGGLNFQVEHHLFPGVCHVHYPAISKIVQETAREYQLPYNSYKTFVGALIDHTKMLKQLGRQEYTPAAA